MQNTSEAIATRILMICGKKQLTASKFAEFCNLNPSTLNGIISGKNNASIGTIEKICKATNLTFADFFSTKALRRLPSFPVKKKVIKRQENMAIVEEILKQFAKRTGDVDIQEKAEELVELIRMKLEENN